MGRCPVTSFPEQSQKSPLVMKGKSVGNVMAKDLPVLGARRSVPLPENGDSRTEWPGLLQSCVLDSP